MRRIVTKGSSLDTYPDFGIVCIHEGHYDEAVEFLKAATRARYHFPEAHYYLSIAFDKPGFCNSKIRP